jgi:hypothetical protein
MADSSGVRPAPNRAGWLVVTLLLLVQFALFRQTVAREIAPAVSLGSDQTSFLAMAYDGYETMLDRGPWAGLSQTFGTSLPSGSLMHPQAAGVFLLLGPSRFAALLPHFLYFAAFQCVVVAVLLRQTRRWEPAYFGLGLLLCAGTTLGWLGGLFDFRTDGIALSLYGILLGLLVLSDGFASRRWALAAAGVACLLFLFRHLTIVYLGGIASLWLAFMLARMLWISRDRRPEAWRRLGNAALACAAVAAVVTPVIAAKRKILWEYYGVGHFTGAEKHVRAAEFGIFTASDSLLYYARSVWNHHGGWLFFAVGSLGLALSLALRRRTTSGPSSPAWALAILGLTVPWLVLTANTSKSPLVGNLLVPALLWLFLLPLARSAAWPAWLLRGAAAVALSAGLCAQFTGYCQREPRFGTSGEDRRQVMALHDDMAEYARNQGWKTVYVSSDTVIDCLPPHTLGVSAYERQGMRLDVKGQLSTSIFETQEAVAWAMVERSHFVVVCDGDNLTPPAYPAKECLTRLGPWLRRYCRSRLEVVGTYRLLSRSFTLYARPSLRPATGSRDWVTSAGLGLDGRAETLRAFPRVRLAGDCSRQLLPRHPKAEVAVEVAREPAWTVPAVVTFLDDLHYVVDFELPADRLPSGDVTVKLSVRFDTHFVPRDLGMNDDVRELVTYGPSQIALYRHGNVGITGDLDQPRPAEGE